MATKNFDLALREQQGDPITFQLGGVEFVVPTPVPSYPLLQLGREASRDADSLEGLGALHDFIIGCIDEDQVEDFKEVLTANRVGFELLMEIVTWLAEEGTARPTEKPSRSQQRSSMASKPSSRKSSLAPVKAS